MVKPATARREKRDSGVESNGDRYKGVRMRKWGKWVAEVRKPNSRDRIWLGSYETAVEAARAYDAAVFCLRGGDSGKFNFPDHLPSIPGASELSPAQIQVVASRHARGMMSSEQQLEKDSIHHQQMGEESVHSSSCYSYFGGGGGEFSNGGIIIEGQEEEEEEEDEYVIRKRKTSSSDEDGLVLKHEELSPRPHSSIIPPEDCSFMEASRVWSF